MDERERRRQRRYREAMRNRAIAAVFLAVLIVGIIFIVKGCRNKKQEQDQQQQQAAETLARQDDQQEPAAKPSAADNELLTLVNPWNPLPDSWTPDLVTLSDGREIDSRCYEAFEEMMDACKAAGYSPFLCSAYRTQETQQGLYDNTDMVYDYLMDVGNRNGKFMDESKNRYLVDHLNQTLDWLTSIEATVKGDPAEVLAEPWQPLSKPVEKDGVLKTHFDVLDVEPIHVSLQPWRVHNSPGGGGQTNGEGGEISTPLTLYYENDLGGEIIYDTAMNEILTDEAGVVTGVTCTRKGGAKLTLYARKGVILATGGYARNKEMVARYPVAHYFSNVPHGNVGDGLTAAEKIGALNYEHPAVQVVYTSLTCGIGINDESGLIVNDRGERVVNEWSYQYTVSDAIARSGSNCGWYITSGKEPYGGVQYGYKSAVAGKSKDPCATSIEGLAKKMGCDPATLQATYDRYCELVEKGVDEDFGKPAEFLHPIKGPKFVALRMHPCVTVTFGGLETDVSARVMKPDGSVIPHLYAAGEVAGTGMYGTQYPTCGTSIGSALFYGRIAGRAVTDQALL